MMNQWRYLLGLLLPLLLACSRAGEHEALFKQVENIVNERPDSAMALLERIEQPETLPDAEWHWGALLWTQAKDKLFIRHTSDSLINSVVAYYDTHGDNHQKALAYYYKGRVHNDLGRLKEATTAYLTASGYAKETSDSDLAFRILTQMGTLYARQGLDHQAFDIYREGLDIAIKANDSVNIAYGYAYLGRIYGLEKNWKDCNADYKHSIAISEAIGDINLLLLGTQELAAYYTDQDSLDIALELMRKVIAYEKRYDISHDYSVDLTIGDIYRKLNLEDSAFFYLNRSLESQKIYTRRSAYEALYHQAKEIGRLREAFYYNELYKASLDTILSMGSSSEISQIRDLFNEKDKEEEERKKQKIYNITFLFVSILLGGILVFPIVWKYRDEQEKAGLWERNQELEAEYLRINAGKSQSDERLKELEEKIDSLEGLLRTQKDEKDIAETKAIIEEVKMERETLKKQIHELKNTLKEKVKEIRDLKRKVRNGEKVDNNVDRLARIRLAETPESLKRLIKRLDKNPKPLNNDEKALVLRGINILHHLFLDRLQNLHVKLNKYDCLLCCLIRLGISDREKIMIILNIDKETLRKRIERALERLDAESVKSYGDLVAYIQQLPLQ